MVSSFPFVGLCTRLIEVTVTNVEWKGPFFSVSVLFLTCGRKSGYAFGMAATVLCYALIYNDLAAYCTGIEVMLNSHVLQFSCFKVVPYSIFSTQRHIKVCEYFDTAARVL